MIDKEGRPFHDPETDQPLFATLVESLKSCIIQATSLSNHLNSEAFAQAVFKSITEWMEKSVSSKTRPQLWGKHSIDGIVMETNEERENVYGITTSRNKK